MLHEMSTPYTVLVWDAIRRRQRPRAAGDVQDHPALRRHHRPDLTHELLERGSFASAQDSQDHGIPDLGLVQPPDQRHVQECAQGRADSGIQVLPDEIRDAIDDRIGGETDAAIECLAAARERTFTGRANVAVSLRHQTYSSQTGAYSPFHRAVKREPA